MRDDFKIPPFLRQIIIIAIIFVAINRNEIQCSYTEPGLTFHLHQPTILPLIKMAGEKRPIL